jgi:prepilin-type processing-associated H-X9-DG protein
MRTDARAFTSVDLVFTIIIFLVLATVAIRGLPRPRPEGPGTATTMKCMNNLRQLGTGMIQYIDQYGKGRYYSWPGPQKPSFIGGQWVASMYWTKMLCEPDLYVCPKSGDENDDGGALGRSFGPIGPRHVSYAGRTGILGAIEDKMPSNTVMMSDDTEATANHDDRGMNLLYFDAHVEWNQHVSPLPEGEPGKARLGVNRPVDMLRN